MIPAELRALKGWLLWKLEQHTDEPKPRKVPYYTNGRRRRGVQGSPEDRQHWATFNEAEAALRDDPSYQGLGLALSPEWGIVGLDFDACVDPEGNVNPAVMAATEDTYSEYSPRGAGVHAFLTGVLPDKKSRAGAEQWGFEVFCSKGFLTMTGRPTPAAELIGWDTLSHVNGAITELFAARFGSNDIVVHDHVRSDIEPEGLTDDDLRQLLNWHDPDAPYMSKSISEGSWMGAGMALHHECEGDRRGLDLWDEYSARGLKYAGRELLESKWFGFGKESGRAVTTARWLRTVAEARSNGLAIDANAFSDLTAPPKAGDPPELPPFVRERSGVILATVDNAVKAVGRPDLCGLRIGHDEFRDEITVARPNTNEWRPMTDADVVQLRIALERMRFKTAPKDLVRDAVVLVATQNKYDSAQLWLSSLVWDGVPRVESFLQSYLGCKDTPYTRAVSLYTWTALAGRVVQPGVKADMVPIFEGAQGIKKSSAIEAMSPDPEFFVEIDLAEKEDDTVRKLRGALIAEIAELSGLHTRDLEGIKKFVARKTEKWVPKYKEFPSTFKRRLIFIGTTNRTEILADDTGNRRWLPLHVEAADVEAITRDCCQLWAEGKILFEGKLPSIHAGGVAWREAEKLANAEHGAYAMNDAWDERVNAWLEAPNELIPGAVLNGETLFSTSDVLAGAVGLIGKEMNRAVSNRICTILRGFGYEHKLVRKNGCVLRVWSKT